MLFPPARRCASITGRYLSNMAYELKDYRRCGLLYYPIRFLLDGSIEVINEPKDEREMLDMIIEHQRKEVENWERKGLLPKI